MSYLSYHSLTCRGKYNFFLLGLSLCMETYYEHNLSEHVCLRGQTVFRFQFNWILYYYFFFQQFLALAGIVVSRLSLPTHKSPLELLMYTVSSAQ